MTLYKRMEAAVSELEGKLAELTAADDAKASRGLAGHNAAAPDAGTIFHPPLHPPGRVPAVLLWY